MPIIVGVPRSGTTLLRMMLDAHPEMAVPPETGFLAVLADLDTELDAGAQAWRIMTAFHTWPDFHLDPLVLRAAIDRLAPAAPATAARAFYRLYAERFGKARWGDKTPTYGMALPRIAALLPEARFVHIIRDGRDVLVSVRNLWFSPGDTIEACAGDWAARLTQTRVLSAQVPSYLEIRYEALVESPERTLREVCQFLDLAFDEQMLVYHERAAARLAEHQPRYAADGRELVSKTERLHNQRLVMQPPCADRVGRWKRELTPAEVRRFEVVAGDCLRRLDYALDSESS